MQKNFDREDIFLFWFLILKGNELIFKLRAKANAKVVFIPKRYRAWLIQGNLMKIIFFLQKISYVEFIPTLKLEKIFNKDYVIFYLSTLKV